MTKPWRNITTIWLDKKNCVFVFISVNLTGDSTNKTNIQKYDVCQLWSCLSCDLLYDLKKDQYAFPVVGSMKFINKITNQHGEYIYNNQNGDFHVVTFFCPEMSI